MIKRKLLTLLSLLIMAVIGANAQEAFGVTWPMGESTAGTASPTTVAFNLTSSTGNGLLVNGTKTFSDITFTNLDMNASESGKNDLASAQSLNKYVEYSFVPTGDITLSSVAFDAVKFGTGDPQAFVTLLIGDGEEKTVIASAPIRRNNDEDVDISHRYELTDAVAYAEEQVTLRIYIGKLAAGKSVGIANVSINGKLGIIPSTEPVVGPVDAESVFINFSELTDGLTIQEPLNYKDVVNFIGSETKSWYAESNEKVFDCGTMFTIRLKSGGAANSSGRYFTVDVAGPCTLEFYAMSGSTGDVRNFNITKGAFSAAALASLTVNGETYVETVSYSYTGADATTLYVIPQKAINFYGLSVIYNGEHPAQHKYYLTGEGETFGGWNPAALELTDCSYTLNALPAGNYQFKLTQDGEWNVNYGISYVDLQQVSGATVTGSDNVEMTLTEESNVTISLNGGKIAIAAESTAPQIHDVTVAQALEIAGALASGAITDDYYRVNVNITEIKSNATNVEKYGNVNLTVADETGSIPSYYTNNLGDVPFTSLEEVPAVGSQVIIVGPLTNYKGTTPEFTRGYIEQIISTPQVGLTYNVVVPENTPAVFIVGDFNNWTEFIEMTKVSDTEYTITIDNATENDKFKFTCGQGWEYVEVNPDYSDRENHTYDPAAAIVVEVWKAIPSVEPQVAYYLTGDGELFGNWDPAALLMENGAYTFQNLPAGTYLFKITEGNWNTSYDCTLLNADASNVAVQCEVSATAVNNNCEFTISEPMQVTIAFDGQSITVNAEAIEPVSDCMIETFSKNIELGNSSGTGMDSKMDQYCDLEGWVGVKANAVYNADDHSKDGLRMGTSNAAGSLTSPAITLTSEYVKVTYVYSKYESNSVCNVTVEGATLIEQGEDKEVTSESAYATFENYIILGNLTADAKVTFANEGGKQRFYLRSFEACPYNGEVPQPTEGLTFNVTVPEGTPAVYIAGAWDEWKAFVPMVKAESADNLYTVTIDNATENHGYKYLCGEDWQYVEVNAEGGEIENRTYNPTVADNVEAWKAIPGVEPEPKYYVVGDGRYFGYWQVTNSNALVNGVWSRPGLALSGTFNFKITDGEGNWFGCSYLNAEASNLEVTCGENDNCQFTADGVGVIITFDGQSITVNAETVEPVMASGTVDFYVPGENAVASTADAYYELPNADTEAQNLDEYSKEAVTVKFVTNGSNPSKTYPGNPPTARWYSKNAIEITIKDYTMTKIEFLSQYDNTKGLPTASTGEITGEATKGGVFTWTGVVTDGTLTLTNETGSQFRFSHMIVTYTDGEVPQPTETMVISARVPEGMAAPYIYSWNEEGAVAEWPGEEMTLENGLYVYTMPKGNSFIFNNGNSGSGNQTADITGVIEDKCYTIDADFNYVEGCNGEQPEAKYYVIGDGELFGNWDVSHALLMENGSYTFKNLPAGTYKFKVTDGNLFWKGCSLFNADASNIEVGCEEIDLDPDGNLVLSLNEAMKVTIAFDGQSITVNVSELSDCLTETFAKYTELGIKNGFDVSFRMDDVSDNAGWTGVKVFAVYDAENPGIDKEGIRIGTGSAAGSITSPALGVEAKNVKVTFKCIKHDSDALVNVSVEGGTIVEQSIEPDVDSYIIISDATADTKVTFANEDIKQRFYLRSFEACPYNGDIPQPAECLTYNVEVPEGTPTVYITGGFNQWSFTKMTKVDETHYTLCIEGATENDQYKYCCGEGWEYVEVNAEGGDIEYRTYNPTAADAVEAWAALPPYFITGEKLVGSWEANAMVMENGSITFTNLAAGSYDFKITRGTWTENWGFESLGNVSGATASGGDSDNVRMTFFVISDVTISFDGEHINITATPAAETTISTSMFVNFSSLESETGDITSNVNFSNIYIVGSDNKPWRVIENSQVFDCATTFTKRLNSGGKASADGRFLSFTVAGACTIEFYAMSNGKDVRTFNITKDSFSSTALTTLSVDGNNGLETVSYSYTGTEPATLFVIPQASINFYGMSIIFNDEHPARQKYYITGEGETFGNWNEKAIELTDCSYTFNELPAGTYSFKITDGTWANSWGGSEVTSVEGATMSIGDDNNAVFTIDVKSDVTISFNGGNIFIYAFGSECLTYNVTVPEGTPAVYIAGEFFEWSFAQMEKVDDTHYTICIEGATENHGYKFCYENNWNAVEKAANGIDDVPNRTYSEENVVAAWNGIGLNYTVNVPDGTPEVYIFRVYDNSGNADFYKMNKSDDNQFTLFINGATADQCYMYFSAIDESELLNQYREVDAQGNLMSCRQHSDLDVVAGWAGMPTTTLTYTVTVPQWTPQVFISGDFNNWTFQPMEKVEDGLFSVTIENTTANMGYKYLWQADWNYREIYGDDSTNDNRHYSSNDEVTLWRTDASVALEPKANDLVYTGEAQILITAGHAVGGVFHYGLNADDMSEGLPKATDAGEYTVYLTIVGDNTHNSVTLEPIVVNIAKADINITAAPQAVEGLVYNGQDQVLVANGEADFGTILYSLDNETFSADLPTGKDAGNYEVFFRIDGDDNHNATETLTLQAKIAIAAVEYTAPEPIQGLEYNGEPQVLINAGEALGGTMLYSLDGEMFSAELPTATDAGIYEVFYRVYGDDNHTDVAPKSFSVKIARADVSYTAPQAVEGLVYNGNALTLIEAGSADGGEMLYALEGDRFSTELPQATDAGEYEIFFRIDGDENHNGVEQQSLVVTIDKADIVNYTAPQAVEGLVFTGNPQALIAAGSVVEGGTMLYSLGGKEYGTALPEATNVGVYEVFFRIEGDQNHNSVAPQSFSVEIVRADINYVAPRPISGLVYNGQQQALLSAGSAEAGYFIYWLDNEQPSREVPTALNAGEYSINFKLVGDESHNDIEFEPIVVTIAKADIEYTAPQAIEGLVYNGQAQTLIAAGSADGGTMFYALDGQRYSTELPATVNAGAHKVFFRIYGDDNHNSVEPQSITVEIAKADIVDYTAPVAVANLVYDGQPHALITAGSVKDGTMLYSLDGKEYSEALPTGIEVGEYTVYFRIDGDQNHNDVTAQSLKAEIIRANAEYTIPSPAIGLIYNGKPQALVTQGVAQGGQFYYWLEGEQMSTSVPTAINAGTYTVNFKLVGDASHDDVTFAPVTVTIAKADLNVTAPVAVEGLVYDGEAHALITDGRVDEGVMLYSINNINYSATVPEVFDAGEYTVYYRVDGDQNHNDFEAQSLVVTVAKADIEFSAPQALEGLVYNGQPQTLIAAGAADFGTMLYSLDGENFSAELPAATDAALYTVYFRIDGDQNHNGVAAQSLQVRISADKAALQQAIDDATAFHSTISNLYPEIAQELNDAIWEAQMVNGNADATQTEVDDATQALLDALEKARRDAELAAQAITIIVPAGEFATGYYDHAITVSDPNVELYTITSIDGDAVYLTQITTAAPYTPFLIYNPTSSDITVTLEATDATPTDVTPVAQFKGTTEAREMPASNGSVEYYIFTGTSFVYVDESGTIPANKCWLELPVNSGNHIRRILFGPNGGPTTGLEDAEAEEVNGPWFDLNGRLLGGEPEIEGIYIHNGKKVLIRRK